MKPKSAFQRKLATTALLGVLGMASAQAATVAYYPFETGPNGAAIGANGSTDSAGTSHMSGFNAAYSSTVPAATVPQTGASNMFSASFSGTGDIFDPAPTTSTLGGHVFTNFTIEAFVRFNALTGFQTVVGRDDSGSPGQGTGQQSLFYLSKAGGSNAFRVELVTASNALIAVSSASVAAIDIWYHLAAVGNATAGTLELFVDGTSVGSTTGFNGMFDPGPNTAWTIGRGQFNGANVDRVNGFIDEVRFSDTALAPSQFLNAIPEPSAILLAALGFLGLLRRRR
jgi:hypothetical protein